MTKKKIIILCFLLLTTCISVKAQSQKTNERNKTRAAQVQKEAENEKKDTVVLAPKQEDPKYKNLSDSMVVKYLRGGFAKGKKLHLITNSNYAFLTDIQKRDVLNKVAQEFTGYDMTLYTGGQQRELWLTDGSSVRCIETWNNDSLRMEDYLPLELKRSGGTKVFYYVGGMLNGGNGSTSYSLNLRGGSYLYKNLLDASATFNIGGNKTDDGGNQFTGDIGLDSRAYLPVRIKDVNLAPYAGVGLSWSFAPESFFEFRLLAGGCWFVGPGSLDIGLQYGTMSDFALMLGYTFHIPVKAKKK